MQLLKGKSALVTGGTNGIGKEIACVYAENGADVAIFGTNQESALAAVKEIEAARLSPEQRIVYYLVDVSQSSLVEEAISKVYETLGKIDILVNNAGIARDNLLLRMSEADWDLVLDVNLKSVYNTCRCVIRSMMKNRSGCIINISSVIGLTGNTGQANYSASKAGMIGFSKSLAKEYAKRNVRVNCIAPGYVKTKMTDALPDEVKEEIGEKIPLSRIGSPRDIANAALYLASELSSYVTGQVLTVDGGMVM